MIHGEKTVLKALTKDCAALIYQWVNNENLRKYTGTIYPVSEYEHESWMQSVATAKDKKLFVIYRAEDNRPIGTIGLKNMNFYSRNAELYISIGDVDSQNSGMGTDAVKTLVAYAFDTLNFHRIYLHVFESNTAAIRCYQKAGFTVEGVLKDHHFSCGKFENTVVMGRLSNQ